MTLRTRLMLAFFAIAVIPLTAVTLFSYYSSERALRRAAEQQAANLAAELGRRMEWVTSDLERRMDQVWPMPAERTAQAQPNTGSGGSDRRPPSNVPGVPPPPPVPDMAGHLAVVLGDAAPMIESLEISPGRQPAPAGPPPFPGGPAGPGRHPAPAPPAPPVKPADGHARPAPSVGPVPESAAAAAGAARANGMVSVEMSRVIDKAMEAYKGTSGDAQFDMSAWSKSMQERIGQAATAARMEDARRLTNQAQALEREAARLRVEAGRGQAETKAATGEKATTQVKGADMNSTVRRDGQEVRIHARLNMPRVFRALLPPRRDEGEVSFAIDENGEVHTRDADKATVKALKDAGAIPKEGATVRSAGDWVVVTRKGPGDMTFGTARPVGNEMRELRTVAVRNFAVGFGLIVLVFFGSGPLAAGMTRNLRTLMTGVQAVSNGNLAARVPVRSNDEFGRLAAAFNQMTQDLAQHEKLVVQQERLKRELELCRQIQNDMLPREPLRLGVAEVKGVSIPAREVGGDFFNYFVLPSGEIAVLVGDVSGKGVGAALLMANVQATLRARLPLEQDLARLAADLDRDLHENTPPEVYLTLFAAIVDPRSRVMRYVNAGHNTQFIVRKSAAIESLPSTGRPLGLLPGAPYEERTAELPAGDVLFFYTDGILDAENEAGEVFGAERLEAVLSDRDAMAATGVDGVLELVESALRNFRGTAEQPDDATMMALRLGQPA